MKKGREKQIWEDSYYLLTKSYVKKIAEFERSGKVKKTNMIRKVYTNTYIYHILIIILLIYETNSNKCKMYVENGLLVFIYMELLMMYYAAIKEILVKDIIFSMSVHDRVPLACIQLARFLPLIIYLNYLYRYHIRYFMIIY